MQASKLALLILMLAVSLLGLICMDTGHSWDDDFALYLQQSQALLDGNITALYEQNKVAMDYSGATTGPYLYPMGFPVLLLPVIYIWGYHWIAIKVYCFLFFVLSLPLVFAVLRHFETTLKYCWLALLMVAFSYHFIRFGDWIYADLPFFFFCFLSLFTIIKLHDKSNWIHYVATGCSLFFAYWIRDIGISLLVFLLVYQYQQGFLKLKKSYLPYLIFGLGWSLVKLSFPNGGENHWELLLANIGWQSISTNAVLYYKLIGNFWLIFKPLPLWLQYAIATVFIVLLLLGIQKDDQHKSTVALYALVLTYLFICLCWISFQGMRFIFPLLPFFACWTIRGIDKIPFLHAWRTNYILLALVWIQTGITTVHYYQKNTNMVHTTEMQTIYSYIQEKLPSDALIQFAKPRTLRLFTGINSCQKIQPNCTHILAPIAPETDKKILFQTTHYHLIEL